MGFEVFSIQDFCFYEIKSHQNLKNDSLSYERAAQLEVSLQSQKVVSHYLFLF